MIVLLSGAAMFAAAPGITVTAVNDAGRPVAGIRVELQSKAGSGVPPAILTDDHGRAVLTDLRLEVYQVTITGAGYQTVTKEVDLSAGQSVSIDVTLTPALARKESIEVKETASPVEEGASPPASISGAAVKQLPSRPATVSDALPMTPGVAREPGGALVISASPEHRSALIVNSADVTDPGTGQFGLTVPIDSVQAIERISISLPGRIRALHGRTGFGRDPPRRREVEVGAERSAPRVPHPQLAPPGSEDRHPPVEFRRPGDRGQAVPFRGLRICGPQDRPSMSCLSRTTRSGSRASTHSASSIGFRPAAIS